MNLTNHGNLKTTISLLSLVLVASFVGSFVGNRFDSSSSNHELPLVLNADTASSGKSLSMATGLVDRSRGVEGLFVLDHLSGMLQCWVINPRTGNIGGIFTANVNEDLEIGKGGDIDYVMTTGSIDIENAQNRRGNLLPAGCVCYVGDGNTGKVVGYTLFFDRQLILKNGTQNGELEVLARGVARESGLRRDN